MKDTLNQESGSTKTKQMERVVKFYEDNVNPETLDLTFSSNAWIWYIVSKIFQSDNNDDNFELELDVALVTCHKIEQSTVPKPVKSLTCL